MTQTQIEEVPEGLRYVNDQQPGYRRKRRGTGWSYYDTSGDLITSDRIRDRIESLAIPPAWTDVWICPSPNGHLQATGRDDRNRKQYRYHQRWREVRDQDKFDRIIDFAEALGSIRRRVRRDLASDGLGKQKVLAVVVRLLDTTCIRVGNEEYAQENGSFGLTTLRDRHASFNGDSFTLAYVGKGGKKHRVELNDPRLGRLVEKCRDIPGQVLFQYLDDSGEGHPVTSTDVNDYLREITSDSFTAKDFRTWAGTVHAAAALLEAGPQESEAAAKRAAKCAFEAAAAHLGNTASICRSCYVHPWVVEGAHDGTLHSDRERFENESVPELRMHEVFVLQYLKRTRRRHRRRAA